jgi:hypothetical protein
VKCRAKVGRFWPLLKLLSFSMDFSSNIGGLYAKKVDEIPNMENDKTMSGVCMNVSSASVC